MRYRIEGLHVEIDTDALAAHDEDQGPPPNDLADWYGGDLERALELGIAEVEHAEITLERAEQTEEGDAGDGR
jgi:hypothetical protein